MKIWSGLKRSVDVEQTLKKKQNRPSEGLGREAETEGRGLPDSCVTVGEVPRGSNTMH